MPSSAGMQNPSPRYGRAVASHARYSDAISASVRSSSRYTIRGSLPSSAWVRTGPRSDPG